MKTYQVKIPKYLSHDSFDELFLQEKTIYELIDKGDKVVLDFTNSIFISTLGCLVLAKVTLAFKENEYECSYIYDKCKNKDDVELLEWFLEVMGLIKRSNFSKLKELLRKTRVPVHLGYTPQKSLDGVNEVMKFIQKNISLSESVLRSLNWIFGELRDNALQHGYKIYSDNEKLPHPLMFCAYNYKDKIEVAILDQGQGIHKSLLESGNESFKNLTNHEALTLCIKEKVSGHPEGSPGFGLFGCAEIARQTNGKLVIISKANKLKLKGNDLQISSCYNFNGTMLLIELDKNIDVKLEKILGQNSMHLIEDIEDLIGDYNE